MNAIRPVWVHVGPTSGGGELLDVAAAVGVVVTDAGDLPCAGPRVQYRVDVMAGPDRVLTVAYFRGPDFLGPAAVAAVLDRAAAVVAGHEGRYGDVFVVDPDGPVAFFDTVLDPEQIGGLVDAGGVR